jgi:hypothetical protein
MGSGKGKKGERIERRIRRAGREREGGNRKATNRFPRFSNVGTPWRRLKGARLRHRFKGMDALRAATEILDLF